MQLFEKHQPVLEKAIEALHSRAFFSQFPEHPSPKVYGETADKEAQDWLASQMNKDFKQVDNQDCMSWLGDEESPYTRKPLGIKYPSYSPDQLISRGTGAFKEWRGANADTRAGVLLESLEKVSSRFFDLAYSTMHTTGQGFMMAFQASGPHAADRALEAVASGYEELKRFPQSVLWDKPMGKYNLQVEKSWRAVPKGLSLIVGCSTFPTWNSVPGIYASLITGNPVIIKPHPGAILPVAIFVEELQKALSESGFSTNICQLAPDTFEAMLTKELAEHEAIKLIDYTGSSEFGNYLEGLPRKITFTEKTGVNSIILDSVEDMEKVAANIAFSISLYSGQMCTAPQNVFIPAEGIKAGDGRLSFEQVAQALSQSITTLADNPKAGPFVLGAIQNSKTTERLTQIQQKQSKIWLESKAISNPVFPDARTATPTVIEVNANQPELYSSELFGPIALLIKTDNTSHSIELAANLALKNGAITCGAYTTDPGIKDKVIESMSNAATPVSFNLVGNFYVNQNASFSDFHVSGGNPAGNASFTNPEFVVKRFTRVGFRELSQS